MQGLLCKNQATYITDMPTYTVDAVVIAVKMGACRTDLRKQEMLFVC